MAEGDTLHIRIISESGDPFTLDLVGENKEVVTTVPGIPTVAEATDLTSSSFSANWYFNENTSGYYLDAAYDTDFTNFVTGFEDLNVGNVNTYSVTAFTDCYYRVRAYNEVGTSASSSTATVVLLESSLFSLCLVRNLEMDNRLSLSASSQLLITAKDTNVITVDNLPNYAAFDTTGWRAMLSDADKTNTSDPNSSGDYQYKNLVTVDRGDKTLTFPELYDMTAWEVGDSLILYHPFLNHEFVGDQVDAALVSIVGAPAWRDYQTLPGPVFRHSDGRLIQLFHGYPDSTHNSLGYIESSDNGDTWIVGNSDAAILTVGTILPGYTIFVLAGGAQEVEGSPGNYFCLAQCLNSSTARNEVRIFYFNEDLDTFSVSGLLIPDDGISRTPGGIIKVGSFYHMLYFEVAPAGVTYRNINAAKCATLDGTYVDYQTNVARGVDGNDGEAWSNNVDAPAIISDGVMIYGLFGATARWSPSGNKANRLFNLLDFDPVTETWSHSALGPVIINPFYQQNIDGHYTWAGDHCGSYIHPYRDGNDMYVSLSMRGQYYQIALIKLK